MPMPTAAPKGTQLRTLNGEYLTATALGQPQEAERAFGQLVDYGLERKRLAVKFLFRPGATEFWPDPAISGPYEMWLRQIANRTRADEACLEVSGHASTTGTASWNDKLSLLRAQSIRSRLVAEQPGLGPRLKTEGFGAARPLIGTGRDDATDLARPSRRVRAARVPHRLIAPVDQSRLVNPAAAGTPRRIRRRSGPLPPDRRHCGCG